jgi:hypothetical protein
MAKETETPQGGYVLSHAQASDIIWSRTVYWQHHLHVVLLEFPLKLTGKETLNQMSYRYFNEGELTPHHFMFHLTGSGL